MSAPLAGKFQDHYEVLGLSPRATLDEIQEVCQRLSDKFDPVMGTEPDLDKFEAVKLALEVLSDADLRAQFDKLKGIEEKPPQFSGLSFFEGLGEDARLRSALLCVLFDRRRTNPFKPSLNMRQIDRIIQADSDSFILATWYLKQRGMITVNDKSHLEITVKGIDELEAHPPSAEVVLSMMRPEGLVGYERPEPQADEVPAEQTLAEAGAPVEAAAASDATLDAEDSGLQALASVTAQDAGARPDSVPSELEVAKEVLEPAGASGKRFRLSGAVEIHSSPVQPASPAQTVAPSSGESGETAVESVAEGETNASNWSVSTPLPNSARTPDETTQTVGGRLQGILGRPRSRY